MSESYFGRGIILFSLVLFIGLACGELVIGQQDEIVDRGLYTIEGKVYPPEMQSVFLGNNKWQIETTVSINSGDYKGYIREDGSFTISGLPSGSYVLDINNPDYYYDPVRVEINPKGKFRARKVNFVQPSQIVQVPYPLKMKALMRFRYFQTREQWKITDLLFSPMILMMVLPLLLMLVLPKIISDPEAKKEIENIQFPKMANEMPEISELLTTFLTGGPKQTDKEKKTIASKTNKKRNQQ